MAPIIQELKNSLWATPIVIATAQHRGMLDQMLEVFKIDVNYDLDLMKSDQSSSELMGRMIPALEGIILKERASSLLAQGDTTTVICSALAAFNQRISFGHVEAGLRTYNLAQPFPEEGYRQMISRISTWNFAPTALAGHNLEAEGIKKDTIFVTGNTCIDALLSVLPDGPSQHLAEPYILLTTHRRENFGKPLRNICSAILKILSDNPNVSVVCPVHPNPDVKLTLENSLAGHSRVRLIPPQDYLSFVALMQNAALILTDSGGIQEEAPALGKPVLVMRETTERPEAIEAGVARLVGTETRDIVSAANLLLQDDQEYAKMSKGASPYGDGRAALRIVQLLENTSFA